HTCALPGDGTVRCWGQNDYGQLGNGTSDPVPDSPSTFNPTPVTVSGITTAVAISAGGWYTCAVLRDGTVRCWGDNNWGQLGNGSPEGTTSTIPAAPATGITTAIATSAGAEHNCVLLRDGTVRCWGNNNFGRVGVGTTAAGTRP